MKLNIGERPSLSPPQQGGSNEETYGNGGKNKALHDAHDTAIAGMIK
jgi:hypothetical protein